MIRRTLFISLICCTCVLQATAQIKIRSDRGRSQEASYIINLEGDTIFGQVLYAKRLFGGVHNKIIFLNSDGERKKIRAHALQGICVNGQTYESKVYEKYSYFMRPAVSGDPSLYYLEHNYVRRDKLDPRLVNVHRVHGRMIRVFVEMRGRLHKMYPKHFCSQSKEIFVQYPQVVSAIERGEYEFMDLEKIMTLCNRIDQGETLGQARE